MWSPPPPERRSRATPLKRWPGSPTSGPPPGPGHSGGLGVSTIPARKALLHLPAEGLIGVSPRRSFRVVQTTPDDIRDVYWIQARIAGQLAHRAARLVDGDALAELAQAHDAFSDAC